MLLVDRRTDTTKLKVACRNFANAPENRQRNWRKPQTVDQLSNQHGATDLNTGAVQTKRVLCGHLLLRANGEVNATRHLFTMTPAT